jgi:hypothetical protein
MENLPCFQKKKGTTGTSSGILMSFQRFAWWKAKANHLLKVITEWW